MNYNKKDFNKEHKRLRLLEIDGKLDMYSAGRLSLIDNVENLILCGVGVRSEQLINPTANCERCGGLIQAGAKVCKHCSGDWVT